jgi:streptogramin lyase
MNFRVRRIACAFRARFHFHAWSGLLAAAGLLPALVVAQTTYTPYTFSTVAGLPGIGSADGTGSAAEFNRPSDLVVDSQGNTYLADTNNSTIRKITPAGVVTTFAGSPGLTGTTDGTGTAARFLNPTGIAMDGAGNFFVADAGNGTIRKITPAGVVTTLAGASDVVGVADGTGTAAQFIVPFGIAVDNSGNVFVSDSAANTIRKVTQAGVVTTYAGVGVMPSRGSTDGAGNVARFNQPHSLALDGAGNVYVADSVNELIRKITPAGVVSTLAGDVGVRGTLDGVGTAALFNSPGAVAVDSSGNVFVADTSNGVIRKITPSGVVTTLAGAAGFLGSTDGTGTAARFGSPTALAIDGSGNIFVTDTGNETIRKVTQAGVVTTLAGSAGTAGIADGTGTSATFNSPIGIAVDGSGNLYVGDTSSHDVRKITSGGVVTTFAGYAGGLGSTDGTGTAILFNSPQGVAVDSAGNVYVADSGNNTIRKITPAGASTTLAGTVGLKGATDGTGTAAQFNFPTGVVVDSSGNLYVADDANNTIRKITPGGVVTTFAGAPSNAGWANGTGAAAQFNNPTGMTMDGSGNLYVADAGNNTIRKIAPGAVVTTVAGSATDKTNSSRDGQLILARFNGPTGVAIDGAGNLLVADTGNSEIRLVSPTGIVSTIAGLPGNRGLADGTGSGAQLNQPEGIALDGSGVAYVADTYNNAVRKVTLNGIVTTLAGTASSRGSADGTGAAARFNSPRGTATDAAGNVYVADVVNDTIRKVTPAGVVTTVAGLPGTTGTTDGTGSAARFTSPSGVAVDGSGHLWVVDTGNELIRMVSPAGVVTTVAGVSGPAGSTDGTGTGALFSSPLGIATDSAGNAYVSDTGNNTIRKVTPAGVVTTLAGQAGSAGTTDAGGTAALFSGPTAVAVDGSGNVYVADTGNDTIRKITSSGLVSTLAGMAGTRGSADGTGTAAQFDNPNGLTLDGAGNVYVADTSNDTIRKITPAGVVTTLAGRAGSIGFADGTGSNAHFSYPLGISADGSGNLYVSDAQNNIIRRVTPDGVVTTLAGSAFVGTKGNADGTGSGARFNEPNGLAVDGSGNLYVGDTFNATVRKIAPDGTVTTLAGTPGAEGSTDGTGNGASFFLPFGVALDNNGNVFVADAYNSTIRKIAPGGVVSTLAGQAGVRGSTDGTASAAAFYMPSSVAVDPSGNIFVADTANSVIRKVTQDGVVTTFAGLAGFTGAVDGTGSAAEFRGPSGVATDVQGNVYVADTGNNTIRKITPNLVVTTVAGSALNAGDRDGTGTNAWFDTPVALTVDNAGNIFVVEKNGDTIRRITPAGVVTTVAGVHGVEGSTDGTGSSALFNTPGGVAVDGAGNLYVADTFNNTIRKGVPSSSTSSTTGAGSGSSGSGSGSGSGGSGTGGSGTGSSGSSGSGSSGTGSSGTGTSGSGSGGLFVYPAAIAEDASGNLYVADASNDVIRKVTAAGVVSTLAGSAGVAGMQDGTSALFSQPNGVAVDAAGNVYVADTGNAAIRKITAAGAVTTLAGGSSNRGNVDGQGTAAQFKYPVGIAVDGAGNLFVADAQTDTIRKVTAAGAVTTLAGTASTTGDTDGTGSAALFNYPSGVTVDGAGNLYVTDTYNDTIRKITAAGVVSTLAGSAGLSGSNDGTGMYGLFNQPVGVTLDASGNLYVADTGNGTIRRVTPAGAVTTVAGMAGTSGLGDGTGTAALFNQPRGITAESTGNLYVADTGNGAIRKISTTGAVTTMAVTTATASGASSTSGSGTATASAGSSGGGGTIDPWLAGALALLGMARWMQQKSRSRR